MDNMPSPDGEEESKPVFKSAPTKWNQFAWDESKQYEDYEEAPEDPKYSLDRVQPRQKRTRTQTKTQQNEPPAKKSKPTPTPSRTSNYRRKPRQSLTSAILSRIEARGLGDDSDSPPDS